MDEWKKKGKKAEREEARKEERQGGNERGKKGELNLLVNNLCIEPELFLRRSSQ